MKAELRSSERLWALEHECALCGAMLDRAHVEDLRDGFRCVFCGAPQEYREPSGLAVKDVGEALAQERERRGETLGSASLATRIHERFLRSLEENAPADAFPGSVYGRFFLREYAEYLGLEPAPLVRAFDRANGTPDIMPSPDRLLGKQPRRGYRAAALIAAIAIAIAAILTWTGDVRGGSLAETRVPSPSPVHSRTQSHQQKAAAASHPNYRIEATVHVSTTSFVRAVIDSRPATGRTLMAGVTRTYRAKRSFSLTLGDGGATVLRVNGQHMATGPDGQVAHLAFEWKNGRLVGPAP
jgi:cytoskeleton protein RodZ